MAKNKKKIIKKFVSTIKETEKAKAVEKKKTVEAESYEAYKRNYRSRKRSIEKAGRHMNIEYGGDVELTKAEWEYYHNAAIDKLTNKEIINMQAYTRTSAQAKNIKRALERAGIKNYTLKEIQYGAGEEYLDIIKDRYDELITNGWTSTEAQKYIGMEYFGSPE